MLNQILVFLLDTFLGLFALALLLRFWLQTLRAPLRNPLYGFLAALTWRATAREGAWAIRRSRTRRGRRAPARWSRPAP